MPLTRSQSIPSFFFKSFLLLPTTHLPPPNRNNFLIDNSSPSGIFFVPEMIQINHMKVTTGQSRFHRINLITGWSVGLIACTVFVMTMEATGSFWDCGEFISSCYKLQIPHPPARPYSSCSAGSLSSCSAITPIPQPGFAANSLPRKD